AALLRALEHVGRAIHANHVVAALGQRHRVSACSAAKIQNSTDLALGVQAKNVLDQIGLGLVVLVLVQLVVDRRVVATEHCLRHASASRTASHTRSMCASSSRRPDGRYTPWRAMRSATGYRSPWNRPRSRKTGCS